VAADRLIDVIILGDGYTTRALFEAALGRWLTTFYAIKVYAVFAGCFRIRALYTASIAPASPARSSFYGCLMEPGGGVIDAGDWHRANDAAGLAFRQAFWAGVDTFPDANARRYPADLDIGSSQQALKSESMRDRYRNQVVVMLVTSGLSKPPSGFTREIYRPAQQQNCHIQATMGAEEIHEFGHAFGLLADEYIGDGRRGETSCNVDPAVASVFSLSNLRYANALDQVPWLHLSPGGSYPRSGGGGATPPPVVGWLWEGGGAHQGVWHAEYKCLMNGGHANFQFTQVSGQDPTLQPDGSIKGAGLRDSGHYCLWCQELVTLRILEKTDQLLEPGDPADITTQGIVWYTRWVEGLRSHYDPLFGLAQQIADAEARYAALAPGPAGEPLWQSDLYSVPTAVAGGPASQVPPLADDELSLLTGLVALG
jgi:hypothetical protein